MHLYYHWIFIILLVILATTPNVDGEPKKNKVPTRNPTRKPTQSPLSRPTFVPTLSQSSVPTGKAQFAVLMQLSANSSFPGRQWHSSVYDKPSSTMYTIGGSTSLILNSSTSFSFQDIWALNTVTSEC